LTFPLYDCSEFGNFVITLIYISADFHGFVPTLQEGGNIVHRYQDSTVSTNNTISFLIALFSSVFVILCSVLARCDQSYNENSERLGKKKQNYTSALIICQVVL
jgi:hypothetical protein